MTEPERWQVSTDAAEVYGDPLRACDLRRVGESGRRRPRLRTAKFSGRCRDRTSDLLLVRQALSQLS